MRLLGSIVGISVLMAAHAPLSAAAQDRITIEIRDHRGGGAPEVVRLSVPLVPRGTSRVDTRVGSADHHVSVSRDDDTETLRFEIRRVDVERGPTQGFAISVGVDVRPGSRAVLAHLRRPDGSVTEIVARRGTGRVAAVSTGQGYAASSSAIIESPLISGAAAPSKYLERPARS